MHASPVPRYSTYPTADRYTEAFTYRDYLQAVASLRTRGSGKALALCVHFPTCDSKAGVYLGYLKREIDMQGSLFAGMNRVEQFYFGGGTPACLSDTRMEELMLHLRRCFQFGPDDVGGYAVDVDPRTVSRERVRSLRRQGFNQISFRMLDVDLPEVAIGGLIDAARAALFRSVSIELASGLPEPSMAALARLASATPDRITVHGHGHLCIATLCQAGYVHLGMDQFARAGDELAIAQAQGRLHRNLQGYSTHPDMGLVGCGVAAISAVAATYSQNVKTLAAYYDLIDRNELPIGRGLRLTMDDALRRAIIQMLMCQFELSIPAIEQAFPIDFADYFVAELEQLAALEQDGLVTLEPEWLSVTARGRVLVGKVCSVFDRYLGAARAPARHSLAL